MSKPKGGHAKGWKDEEEARQTSERITAIAHLIRAISVLLDALRGWF